MNIAETSKPIAIKFYLKHHWSRGKAACGFCADRLRTLVSMATDSVIMGKTASSRFLECFFYRIFLILAGNGNMHKGLGEFEIWPDSTTDYGVSCP